MPYAIHELELSRPLDAIQLQPDENGVALLVRDQDHPVGFVLHATSAGALLTPAELAPLVVRESATGVIARRSRGELEPAPARYPVPSLTIAICTKDRPELLRRCLESVRHLPSLDGTPMPDVLVVDNAPSDARTREIVASQAGVRYVVEPRTGLDFARNRALRESASNLVAFIDDDAVVDRGWLAGLADAVALNPDAGAYTGLVLPYALRTTAQILFEANGGFRRGFLPLRYRGAARPGHPWYPVGAGIFGAGCNMVFRREALLALGGFDDALDTGRPLPGGGDLDAFFRVLDAGHTLAYEPRMLVFHEHRPTIAALRRQYWTWGLGFFAFLQKHYARLPNRRAQIRDLAGWWMSERLRDIAGSLRRRHALPPDMIVAELAGALQALTGTYRRSVRRTRRIREAHGS